MIEAKVYDLLLDDYVADPLDDVLTARWLEEYNGVGSGEVSVPLSSPSAELLTKHRVVELWYEGDCRFAFSVEQRSTTVVGEAGTRVRSVSGRGLLAWLADGVLVPQAGEATMGTTRPFNFVSHDVGSRTLGATWGACTSVSTTEPDGWPDPAALWITATAGSGTVGSYMRSAFAASGQKRVRLAVGSTAPFTVLVDGYEVMALGARTGYSEFRTVDLDVPTGTHQIGVVSPSASCQVIVSLREIDEETGNLAAILLRSSTAWTGTTDGPAWTPGDVLATSVSECQAIGINRLDNVTLDFDADVDADGAPWASRVWREWPAGTDLLSLAQDLVEFGCDLVMDHYNWRLGMVNMPRGSTVPVTLSPGVNIESYSVEDGYVEISNVWVVRDGGKTWQEWGVPDDFRRDGVVQAGDALRNSDVAAFAGQAIYATRPGPVVSNATCIPVTGAVPYVDFTVGDTITAPDEDGNPAAARVMGLAVWMDDIGTIRFTPDLELGAAGTRRFALEADGKYAQTLARQTWDGSLGGLVQNASPLDGDGVGALNPFDAGSTLTGDLGVPPGSVLTSPVEPLNPGDGQLWLDPTTGELSLWDEGLGDWKSAGGGPDEVYIGSDTPPTDTGLKLWVDTSGA